MQKAGIIVNMTKDIGLKYTSMIVEWLEERNIQVFLPEIAAEQLDRQDLSCSPLDIYKQSDFVMVLGGDGTLLGVARQILWLKTPILGINLGHLGFITEVETEDIFSSLEGILKGEYRIEERMLIEASVIKDGVEVETFYCLNDIGITRGTLSRIITLDTYINNSYVDTYSGDGLLVSTPTGSTAYSLSAGGPIISPWLDVILITPICPHSLSSRSIVVSKNETIEIRIENNCQEIYLTADGQQGYKLRDGDKVIIRTAPFSARLIKVSKRSFYDVLRTKLKERSICGEKGVVK